MKKDFFKPQDFMSAFTQGPYYSCDTANQKLEGQLAVSTVVYSTDGENWSVEAPAQPKKKAYLMFQESLQKEPCPHQPSMNVMSMTTSLENGYLTTAHSLCNLCGKKLQAKWEVME